MKDEPARGTGPSTPATPAEARTKRQRRIVRAPAAAAVQAIERVRRELGLVDLADFDVALVAAHYGLVPRIADLENEEAHVIRAGRRGIVCIARRVWEAGTWRFPFAHELGHWLLDRGHDDFARCATPNGERARGARRSVESVASDFAGLFLVPEDCVRARWDLGAPALDDVRAIAAACGTSAEVAALRVLQMTSAPRAIAVSRGGVVAWWAETPAFGARVRAGRPVPAESEAGRLHGLTRDHAGAEEESAPVADAWDHARVAARAVRSVDADVVVSWLGAG